jgi:hypothetical protein
MPAGSVNFRTGVVVESGMAPWRTAHAVLMTLSWGFMLPIGKLLCLSAFPA